MATQRLTDWFDGDRLSASHLQEAVDMLRELSGIMGGGGTEVTRFPMGTAIHTPDPPTVPAVVLLVRPTANDTGGGKYLGYIVKNPATGAPAAGNLSASELGNDDTDTGQVRILNVREESKSTHDLVFDGTRYPRTFFGRFRGVADDGKLVYAIDGVQSKDCPTP